MTLRRSCDASLFPRNGGALTQTGFYLFDLVLGSSTPTGVITASWTTASRSQIVAFTAADVDQSATPTTTFVNSLGGDTISTAATDFLVDFLVNDSQAVSGDFTIASTGSQTSLANLRTAGGTTGEANLGSSFLAATSPTSTMLWTATTTSVGPKTGHVMYSVPAASAGTLSGAVSGPLTITSAITAAQTNASAAVAGSLPLTSAFTAAQTNANGSVACSLQVKSQFLAVPVFSTTPYDFTGKPRYLVSDPYSDSYVGTALNATTSNPQDGYIEVTVSCALRNLTQSHNLASRWKGTSDNSNVSSWIFQVDSTGKPYFAKFASTAGGGAFGDALSSVSLTTVLSTADLAAWRRVWIRVRANASTGTLNGVAAGNVQYFTSFDGSTYTPLSTVTGFAQTGFASPGAGSQFTIGTLNTGNTADGRFFDAVAKRADGSIFFNPDFTALAVGQKGTFNDTAAPASAWTINGPILADMTPVASSYPRFGRAGTGKIKTMELLPIPPAAGDWGAAWINYSSSNFDDRMSWSKSVGANAVKLTSVGVGNYPTPAVMETTIIDFARLLRKYDLYYYLSVGHSDEISGPAGADGVANAATIAAHVALWMRYAADRILGIDLCNEVQFGFPNRPSTWGASGSTTPNVSFYADMAYFYKAIRTVAPDVPMSFSAYMNNKADLGSSKWLRAQATLGLQFHDYHPYNGQNGTSSVNTSQTPAAADVTALEAQPWFLGKHLVGEWGIVTDNTTANKTNFMDGVAAQGSTAKSLGWVAFGDLNYTSPFETGAYSIHDDATLSARFAAAPTYSISDGTNPTAAISSTVTVTSSFAGQSGTVTYDNTANGYFFALFRSSFIAAQSNSTAAIVGSLRYSANIAGQQLIYPGAISGKLAFSSYIVAQTVVAGISVMTPARRRVTGERQSRRVSS